MKRTSGLEGSPVELMRRLRTDDAMLRRYFHYDSQLWRAIQNHIWKADVCYLIEKPYDDEGKPRQVVVDRAHGGLVHWKDARTFGTQYSGSVPYEVDYFQIDFDVTYRNDDWNERGEQCVAYTLRVPLDLEENFTEEKFEQWLKEKEVELRLTIKQREIPLLRDLLEKHPQEARSMLGGK